MLNHLKYSTWNSRGHVIISIISLKRNSICGVAVVQVLHLSCH